MSDRKPRRVALWVKGVLAVSLALNLLVVGVVAGSFLARGPWGGDRAPDLRSLGLGPFAMALPRADRQGVIDRIDRAQQRHDRREIGAAMRDLVAALQSDPFDTEAAAEALRRARMGASNLQERGHLAVLDQLAAMSHADRVDLSERMQGALRRMSHGRGE